MRKFLLFSLLSILFSAEITSYSASSGADFLNTNVSPRSEAMGAADVSVITDISGININPSSVAFLQVPEVYLMQKNVLGAFQTFYFAGGFPMGLLIRSNRSLPKKMRWIRKVRVGTSFFYWRTNDFDEIGNDSRTVVSTVGASDMFGSLALGYNLYGYRIGGSFKFINRNLAEFSASTVAFDFGMLKGFDVPRPLPYQKRYNLRAGLAITNLGPGIQFNQVTEALPIKIKPGVSYGIYGNRDHQIDLNVGITQIIQETTTINTGLEYRIFNAIFFRTGLEILPGDTVDFTMGAGGQYTFRKVNYSFNYSFLSRTDGVPDNHTFSLGAKLLFAKIGRKKRVTSLGIIQGETSEKKDEEDKGGKIKIRKKRKKKKRKKKKKGIGDLLN